MGGRLTSRGEFVWERRQTGAPLCTTPKQSKKRAVLDAEGLGQLRLLLVVLVQHVVLEEDDLSGCWGFGREVGRWWFGVLVGLFGGFGGLLWRQ